MAKDDHPPQGGWRDNIGFCISVFYLIFAIAAFVLTLATAGGCDILLFDPQRIPPGEDPLLPPELRHLNETLVGLYRYDPDGNGCRKVSDDFDSVGGWYTGARVGNSLAIIFGAVALVLYLIELCCCRYPCSRLLIAISWGVAFISSALVFLMYNTDLCQPPFRDASYPCSPEKGTWIGVSATVLLFIVTCWTCCNAKPTPIFMRVREYAKNDQNDACCAICKKEKKDEEAEGTEEEGEGEVKDKEAPQDDADVVVAGGAVVEPGKEEEPGEGEEEKKDEEEEQHPMTQQEVDEHATKAVVVTTLATARRGKQDEIEKQLELLTKYKDNIPEEEYNEKVGKLLAALPDPDTFDRYTKTADLNDMHDNEQEEEKEEEKGLDKDEEEEKDEEKGLDDDDDEQQHGDDEDGSDQKDGNSEEKQGGEEADLLGMEEGKEEEGEEVKQSRASKAASATKGAAVATGAAIGSGFKAMAKPFHKTSKPADAAMEVETEVDA